MYVKLFSSLYQGTLRGRSDDILVFTNLLAHSDAHGIVDKHFKAISDETGLPLDRVEKAIISLESPDPESRSPEAEGRRIIRIDEHRVWGWKIVNYGKYRQIRNEEDRREQNRLAQERWRSKHSKPRSAQVEVEVEVKEEAKALKSKHKPVAQFDKGEVLEKIPMLGGEEFEVRQSFASELERLYPNVDIPATLRQMRGWCIGNPNKLKTPRGIRKFITGWCERDQNGR